MPFGPARSQRLCVFAGHDDPLELVDHLGQQVERLGVLLHTAGDHLRGGHHLLVKMADVLRAALNARGHRLDGGSEFLHAAPFGELPLLTPFWLPLLVSRLLLWLLASIMMGSGRVVGH